ncbi:MAG: nicotinate-nucleotide--dimethylbenzimidazole phosphoribosyltransferase [Desulfobacteraceae bacterium]|nr:nicotinate-nucleotide--dimethylbenzimidazole phosphoribosyltransferase [Desulfobacteraceae bacterium]
MTDFNIKPVSKDIIPKLQHTIDNKTKPLGALGKLETIALKIGQIQNTLTPALVNPTIIVFAGDHGVAREGVSSYPQEVTYQMVLNFLNGGAGINVFCRQNKIDIKVVDAGVCLDFEPHPNLIDAKIAKGTRSYLQEPAMTTEECMKAISKGAEIIKQEVSEGCNVIGFGEMGIGNTSSASILMSLLCEIPIDQCVGRGTGLDDKSLENKKKILSEAVGNHLLEKTPLSVLSVFGGFEIAMMCGAMLQAAESGMILLIDGFIATSALLVASAFNLNIRDYCIFTHESDEQGHRLMLKFLEAEPIANLNMRLGEGTGAAVTYPIILSAVNFLNEMASFESAEVSKKIDD